MVGGQLQRDADARHTGSFNYISFGDWSRRTFGWLPMFEFGEFGRWLSLAGTLARVSLLAMLMALTLLVPIVIVIAVFALVLGVTSLACRLVE